MAEFLYAYLSSNREVIIRVKIPTTLNRSFQPEAKVVNLSETLPENMILLSHNHILYMIGGRKGFKFPYEYNNLLHMFDPTKLDEFKDFPVENIEQLPDSKFEPMMYPLVIGGAEAEGFYLLSITNAKICEPIGVKMSLYFQYFDPINKVFETRPPPPPYPTDCATYSCLPVIDCYFFLRGYIYLCLRGARSLHTFKFNTMGMESKWEDCNAMLDIFKKKCIPFPFDHFGNMGISDEFAGRTWILVALTDAQPTAYHVRLGDNGDIEPLSFRVLAECKTDFDINMPYSEPVWKQLSDMGGGRFCVMRTNLREDIFLIYVFSIDFSLEYDIQTSGRGVSSSLIIFSMKFRPDNIIRHTIPGSRRRFHYTGFCIASAPPLASPGNEDQDRDDRKMKRNLPAFSILYTIYWRHYIIFFLLGLVFILKSIWLAEPQR